jgi:hypothetical protein
MLRQPGVLQIKEPDVLTLSDPDRKFVRGS